MRIFRKCKFILKIKYSIIKATTYYGKQSKLNVHTFIYIPNKWSMDNITQNEGFGKRKYFSFEERKILEKLCKEDRYRRSIGEKGISKRSMGEILGRSHSTIKKELERMPRYELVYSASWAHGDYLRKQQNKGNVRKLDRDITLRSAVIEGILGDKSPEQISKRIKKL